MGGEEGTESNNCERKDEVLLHYHKVFTPPVGYYLRNEWHTEQHWEQQLALRIPFTVLKRWLIVQMLEEVRQIIVPILAKFHALSEWSSNLGCAHTSCQE